MWNVKVNTRLHAKESWDIVSKGCVEPTYEEYSKKNDGALSLIHKVWMITFYLKLKKQKVWSILEKEYSEKGSFVHVVEHEHDEGESHYVDTLVDDEVEVEK